MTREGKLYVPTGTMLSAVILAEASSMSAAQRAAALAEEKRNRRLAKQMALSGKARRRQELDERRLLHNRRVKAALEFGELARNRYLKAQLTLLAPFVKGAKRSLQAQLGLHAHHADEAAKAADDAPDAAGDAERARRAKRRHPPPSRARLPSRARISSRAPISSRARLSSRAPISSRARRPTRLLVPRRRSGRSERREARRAAAAATAAPCAGSGVASSSEPAASAAAGGGGGGGEYLSGRMYGRGAEQLETFTQEEALGEVREGEVSAAELGEYAWLEATLQPHQVEGLNWMLSAYRHGINGILADEMGLGKTIQTIAFLGYLKFEAKMSGPSLVVAPLSVLSAGSTSSGGSRRRSASCGCTRATATSVS